MAKRYGRKQKQAHRILIRDLTGRLFHESTACMYLPGDGVPDLASVARVVDYTVSESGGHGRMIERSATVTVEAIEVVYEMIRNQTPVQFQGKQYIIVNGQYDVHYDLAVWGGPAHCELELMGVAS